MRDFNRAISSKPSRSGIRMSTIARSGRKSAAIDSASRDDRVADDLMLFAQHALDRAQHSRLVVHDQDARRSHEQLRVRLRDAACGTRTWTCVPLPGSL